MALTRTSLASALDAGTLTFHATSATGATVGGFAKIDNEYSVITAVNGNAVTVRSRGDLGGVAVAHGVLAPVTFGVKTDLPIHAGTGEVVYVPTQREDFLSVGADGAIPVPVRDTTYLLTKATALAATFGAPTLAQDGLTVRFISNTDAAHVLTTADVLDGTTGANDTLTFSAFIGASITLVAVGGTWRTAAMVAVTPSASV